MPLPPSPRFLEIDDEDGNRETDSYEQKTSEKNRNILGATALKFLVDRWVPAETASIAEKIEDCGQNT